MQILTMKTRLDKQRTRKYIFKNLVLSKNLNFVCWTAVGKGEQSSVISANFNRISVCKLMQISKFLEMNIAYQMSSNQIRLLFSHLSSIKQSIWSHFAEQLPFGINISMLYAVKRSRSSIFKIASNSVRWLTQKCKWCSQVFFFRNQMQYRLTALINLKSRRKTSMFWNVRRILSGELKLMRSIDKNE